MEILKNKFEEIKKAKNPEVINDFLMKLSEEPSFEYLNLIQYFIDNLETQIFQKIKLNIIFLLGEIGKSSELDFKYLKFLLKTYYKSDRWVRNEIIQAFGKILKNTKITDDIFKLIGYAINDDYSPIRVNALKTILDLEDLPLFIQRNLYYVINLHDPELELLYVRIFERFLPDFTQLFDSLNNSDNYKILKIRAFRALLFIYFKSPINLETFRQKISKSKWEDDYKENFLKEIDMYEKLLLKRL
ncbi:hypothetical protein ES703_61830 [subsurface metagenome]